jgi:DNA primase
LITQQTIQEIVSRIDIVDVVGEFVKLKRRGQNHLGLCPFHNEKTPSFTVSQSKEIYKCFGCGRSGNTIGFLMEHEKYSYVEALRWLAARYNIEVVETEATEAQKQQQQVADSLFILNAFARDYFVRQLLETEAGRDIAGAYLAERGFTPETISHFQIGYAPEERDAFARASIAAQYNPELLLKSGLVVKRDERYIDNYRGRIVFPIHNQSGKVIGFGARVIGRNDKAPKYINTPENEVYVKSRILYGSYFARHSIDKEDECLLVEGYTDVVSLHQAGVANVVASGGTSLTTDQLRLIRKYTSNLTIVYDGDAAGVKAALRGLDLAVEEGLHVKLVLIPDGDDPDSYVNKVGAEAFKRFIRENRKDVILFQLEVSLKEAGDDTNRKAEVVNRIAETISKLNKAEDFTRQQDYIQQCAQRLRIDEQGLTTLVNKFIRDRISKDERRAERLSAQEKPQTAEEPPLDQEGLSLLKGDEKNERGLLRALIDFGTRPWEEEETVADYLIREIDGNGLADTFDDQKLVRVYESYKQLYLNGSGPTSRDFLYHQDPTITSVAVQIMEAPSELSPRWGEFYDGPLPDRDDVYRQEVLSSLTYLKLRKIRRLIVENQADIEKNPGIEELALLLNTHQHLKTMEMELTKALGTVIIR